MPKLAFSDRWIANVRSASGTTEYVDAACPNLRLRVGARTKTFSVMVGDAASRRRLRLGKYPEISLADARKRAETADDSPSVKRVVQRESRFGTVRELFEFVVDQMEAEGKNAGPNRTYLLTGPRAAVDAFGENTLARNVTAEDVADWLRDIYRSGVQTIHPRSFVSSAFRRGMLADNDPTKDIGDVLFGIETNPVTNVGGGGASRARHRKLSLDELRTLWSGLPTYVSAQTTCAIRLIISLGGVRITEVLRSEKAWWIDGEPVWLKIPATKNETEHALPLPEMAAAQLSVAKLLAHPEAPFLFPHRFRQTEMHVTPNTLSQAIRRYCDETGIERFQPRDLRRTMKSHLLDSNDDLQEAWLDIWHNHGRNATVARKHYDRAEYRRVKKRVADAIDRLLESVVK
ncbi:MAG: integrase family protein [Pseudomonadota bacterium]